MSSRRHRKASEPAQRWLWWVSVSLITLIAFEALAVSTAMPTVVTDLDGEHWYAIANGIVLATQVMTTAICGLWTDAKGAKPALLSGIVLVASGLAVAAMAPTIYIFTLGRFVQGLGGGLCIVPLYVLIGRLIPGDRQPSFFAAFAAAWVLPSLIGPFIAGAIVENIHWRVVFGIVPVILVVFLPIVLRVFRMLPPMEFTGSMSKVGPVGAVAIGAGLGAIALQFMSGIDAKDFSPLVLLGIAVAASLCLGCARPLLPPGTLVSAPGVPSVVLYRGFINGTFLAIEMYLPLLLQRVHGWTPTQAGLALTIGSITWAVGSAIQARVIDPDKRRKLLVQGATIAMAGFALTVPVCFTAVHPLFLIASWSLAGLGAGIAFPSTTTQALGMTPKEQHGTISSSLEISATLGASIFMAVAGIIFAAMGGSGSLAFATVVASISVASIVTIVLARRAGAVGKVTDVAPTLDLG